MKLNLSILAVLGLLALTSCGPDPAPTADQVEAGKQEAMLQESTRQVDLPNITNFQEKRTLKLVEELADRAVPTYAYHYNPFKGCYQYIGPTYGYPIPYATQYTNPQKLVYKHSSGANWGQVPMANADPNGLFKPPSADGTWVLMQNPATKQLEPQYIEEKVNAFTFRQPLECKPDSAVSVAIPPSK